MDKKDVKEINEFIEHIKNDCELINSYLKANHKGNALIKSKHLKVKAATLYTHLIELMEGGIK